MGKVSAAIVPPPGIPQAELVHTARAVVAAERASIVQSPDTPARDYLSLAREASARLSAGTSLPVVLNGTGVILNTNLGRAPWGNAAIRAAQIAAAGYMLLEVDPSTGRRGSRFPAIERLIAEISGAQGGLAVNNNAAALALAVRLAGRGGGVAISRSELPEIGGGVRIPDIIRRVGARLIEVGTTNRTRVADFEAVLKQTRVGLMLRVHTSNFEMTGFVERPDPKRLGELARRYNVPLVEDLGSGALLDTSQFGLRHEPMPAEALRAGANLVTFSGDKLVGGPQAGLIAGDSDLVGRIQRDPMTRLVRLDKVVMAALAATLEVYRSGRALVDLPVWRMIDAAQTDLQARASSLSEDLRPALSAGHRVRVVALLSMVGGGALPGDHLPSAGIAISSPRLRQITSALRLGHPAVMGRVHRNALLIDLRTIVPEDDELLRQTLGQALAA